VSSSLALDCHYCVRFDKDNSGIPQGCTPEGKWTFPPHIPISHPELLEVCVEAFKSGAVFHQYQDALKNSLVLLSLSDVISFSQVNKCCYLASKANCIWEGQLRELFPSLTSIPANQCGFSVQQQFVIYFTRMKNEQRSYQIQFARNQARIKELRGSTGFNGAIDAAWKEFERAGGVHALHAFRKQISRFRHNTKIEIEISKFYNTYNALNNEFIKLAGYGSDGTSALPGSEQETCQLAIDAIPKDFDHQDKFEKTIERTQAVRDEKPIPEDPFYSDLEENKHEAEPIYIV
jgi:hypothetical protein